MIKPLKILFATAEAAPFAKTGGLGDVGGSLPKALKAMGHDVRVVMPAYQEIEESINSGRFGLTPLTGSLWVPTGPGPLEAGVFEGRLPGSDVPVYFIAQDSLFNRPQLYSYWDDPYRFAFFSRATLELTLALEWRPDVYHAHDWHTAPAIAWLSTAGQGDDRFRGIASLFTIHNLAHQGRTSWNILEYLGINTNSLVEEPFGEVNFMARGIYHATMINTVSPTYAQEILTPDGGAGLNGLLRHRANDVHGILNGIDTEVWNPETDARIPGHFTAQDLSKRLVNKRALQTQANLEQQDDVPLVAMITRLDWQKGLDITGHVIHMLLNSFAGEAQFVVLGTGAAEYEQMFAQLAGYHRGKMAAFLSYNPGLAPLIYAGSDLFIMPSRFEPCGLGQLIAMRYGSVPVVRATGGLADTVQDGFTGFTFSDYSAGAFWDALQRGLTIFHQDQERWHQLQQNGMKADYSWERSAQGYQQVYEWALARTHG